MKQLKFKPEIIIKVPNTIKEIKNKNYMKIKVRESLNNNINSYWRDNINPDYKYIGISSVMIDKKFRLFSNNFLCGITFSSYNIVFYFFILY